MSEAKRNIYELNAVDCSDIIRFYGEVVERGAKRPKLKPVPKGTPEPPQVPSRLGPTIEALDEKRKGYQKDTAHLGTWEKDPAKGGKRLRKKTSELTPEEKAAHEQGLTATERVISSKKGGISRWKQVEGDLMLRMDMAFGLTKGATISGTTTDTIFFINRFSMLDEAMKSGSAARQYYYGSSGPRGLDPVY